MVAPFCHVFSIEMGFHWELPSNLGGKISVKYVLMVHILQFPPKKPWPNEHLYFSPFSFPSTSPCRTEVGTTLPWLGRASTGPSPSSPTGWSGTSGRRTEWEPPSPTTDTSPWDPPTQTSQAQVSTGNWPGSKCGTGSSPYQPSSNKSSSAGQHPSFSQVTPTNPAFLNHYSSRLIFLTFWKKSHKIQIKLKQNS